MPCPCCGQRLPGEPTKTELARQRNHEHAMRRKENDYSLALGLRAEGVRDKEIARIRGLYHGMGLAARRWLRGLGGYGDDDWAPGMVIRWGKGVEIA